MIDSNEYKDQENKESDTALVPSELHILVTDADTNGCLHSFSGGCK